MRSNPDRPHFCEKALGVMPLIATDDLWLHARQRGGHRCSSILPGATVGLGNDAIHNKTIPMIHEHMAAIAELSLMVIRLSRKQSIWICCREMGLVAGLKPTKITPLPSVLETSLHQNLAYR